jgi:deazaflavin-dependent oxidoreductase (nitroreductase family)
MRLIAIANVPSVGRRWRHGAVLDFKYFYERKALMAEYIPPALDWVREQVELYEGSGGTEGTTLRETGLPCIIVTHTGNKSGSIRKIPLMRVNVDNSYVLVGSYGGRPDNPVWVYNLRANPDVEIRDKTEVFKMRVREVTDDQERGRLWEASAKAFPPYNDYQTKTSRKIPVFIAELV